MQTIATNQTVISLTLFILFLFGILYALLVRWMSARHIYGQTAYLVVGGVAVTLLVMIPTLGARAIELLFVAFAASGFPMVAEYVIRTENERRAQVQAQVEEAQAQADAARETLLEILEDPDDR